MRCLEGITNSMELSLGKLKEMVKDRELSVLQSMGLQGVRQHLVTEQQQQSVNLGEGHLKLYTLGMCHLSVPWNWGIE